VLVEWVVAQTVPGKTLCRSWKFFLDMVQPMIERAFNTACEEEKKK
jgi:hypothetical protein